MQYAQPGNRIPELIGEWLVYLILLLKKSEAFIGYLPHHSVCKLAHIFNQKRDKDERLFSKKLLGNYTVEEESLHEDLKYFVTKQLSDLPEFTRSSSQNWASAHLVSPDTPHWAHRYHLSVPTLRLPAARMQPGTEASGAGRRPRTKPISRT